MVFGLPVNYFKGLKAPRPTRRRTAINYWEYYIVALLAFKIVHFIGYLLESCLLRESISKDYFILRILKKCMIKKQKLLRCSLFFSSFIFCRFSFGNAIYRYKKNIFRWYFLLPTRLFGSTIRQKIGLLKYFTH